MAKLRASLSKFVGSLQSQRAVREQRQLESALKQCEGEISNRQGKLAIAEQGKVRANGQIAAGQGRAYQILEFYVEEIGKIERMVKELRERAAEIQQRIDALKPTPAKAAERAKRQKALALDLLMRVEADRLIDRELAVLGEMLCERSAATSRIREQAQALDFNSGLDLDGERFDRLRAALPVGMSRESERFARWFLGWDGERTPYRVTGGEYELPETLASHNAFRSGDTPPLTAKERAELDAAAASRIVPPPMDSPLAARSPGTQGEAGIDWVMPTHS
jgi:hypothetical protein